MNFKQLTLSALTLALTIGGAAAQTFEWGLRLDTKFDNHERDLLELTTVKSSTLFSARLSPVLGIGWEAGTGKHNVLAGVSFTYNFSVAPAYNQRVEELLYYQYASPLYTVFAGRFERRNLRGLYSRAMYSGIATFYDNIVEGLAMQFHAPGAKAEVVLDWDGAQSAEERESFRVMISGDVNGGGKSRWRWLEAGASVDWYHLASRAGVQDGVVEHVMVDGWAGAGFHRVWPWWERLALSVGWLQAMDRDRTDAETGWINPGGLTVDAGVQKWRVGVRNRYYHGLVGRGRGLQMPLWGEYGNRIYKGDPIYASARRYNYTAIYWKPRIGRGVELHLELGLHSDMRRVGFQQTAWVGVTLDNDFFKRGK